MLPLPSSTTYNSTGADASTFYEAAIPTLSHHSENIFLSWMHTSLKRKTFRGALLGKKKVLSEEQIRESMVYPSANDILGIAVKLLGFDRVLVKCQDGRERLCRIRGKMKRRVWIREGDVVLVSPWDFQADKRGDIIWRYTRAQAELLRRRGLLNI